MIKHVVSYSQFLLPSCYPVEYTVTRFNARSRVQNRLRLFPNSAYMELNGRQDIPSGGQHERNGIRLCRVHAMRAQEFAAVRILGDRVHPSQPVANKSLANLDQRKRSRGIVRREVWRHPICIDGG